MDIFREIKELNFSLGSYVVVGSGVLAAHGLRQARDLDVVVTPELYEKCENEGWQKQWHNTGERYALHKQGEDFEVELYLDVNCGDARPTTNELIGRADVIKGVPFASLHDLLAFKKAYGRPQDLSDIKLIEAKLAEVCGGG